MVGIVLASHGKMCEGMLDSASLFFGDNIEQLVACPLFPDEGPDDYDLKLQKAIQDVDTGDGVIVMVDLFGGTPSNRSIYVISDKVMVITGMNFTMLLELLGARMGFDEVDVHALMETGKEGIKLLNDVVAAMMAPSEEEEY
ncbi:MAG: PTS mannose transporter subunit IIA [Erysipelotrichaceae bacterium]|nr:PTS mannose transporter subunit IIA [Erysipelotrichaceae bacterium]